MFDGLQIEVSGRPQSDSAEVLELSRDDCNPRRLECRVPKKSPVCLRFPSPLLFNARADRSKISRLLQPIAPEARTPSPLLIFPTVPEENIYEGGFMRKILFFLCLFLLCVISGSLLHATIFGRVQGVVHDPQHRPVAGASVKLAATNSDWSQTAQTDSNGEF